MKLIKHLAGKSTNKLDNEIVKIIEKEHKRLYENK